jgi:hypothetical protein
VQQHTGSLITVLKGLSELSKHKLDIAGVQDVRQERGGTLSAGEHTLLYEKRNENHQLGTGCLVHKRAGFVSDSVISLF